MLCHPVLLPDEVAVAVRPIVGKDISLIEESVQAIGAQKLFVVFEAACIDNRTVVRPARTDYRSECGGVQISCVCSPVGVHSIRHASECVVVVVLTRLEEVTLRSRVLSVHQRIRARIQ